MLREGKEYKKECCGCEIITRLEKFIILCLYRPSSENFRIFLHKLEQILEIYQMEMEQKY